MLFPAYSGTIKHTDPHIGLYETNNGDNGPLTNHLHTQEVATRSETTTLHPSAALRPSVGQENSAAKAFIPA